MYNKKNYYTCLNDNYSFLKHFCKDYHVSNGKISFWTPWVVLS